MPGQTHVAELVELQGVTRSYGQVVAVHPLDLTIRRGEFLAILGPSGCGKTTLLKMIGGFVSPSAGTISINGEDVTRVYPERRSTNMVFQGYGLFPHMTVAQNIAYGLHVRKTPKAEMKRLVDEAMELVHLGGFGSRSVTELSGGQAQRVALARALVLKPEVLLLDEPLAALDLKLRKSMQEELRRIHEATRGTFVFVTHDQEEAMALANRICVMAGGRVVQDGSPEEIYSQPRTHFVSTFIGDANLMNGWRASDVIRVEEGPSFPDTGPDGPVTCVVRPERMEISAEGGGDLPSDHDARLPGTLEQAVFLGPFVKYTVRLEGGTKLAINSRNLDLRHRVRAGESVQVGWSSADQMILSGKD